MPIAITGLYAGLLGLLLVGLSLNVIRLRRRYQVGIGSGERRDLERAIRAQGNLAEYAPLVLVLLALTELGGGPAWLLHLCGAVFVAARLSHAWALSRSARGSPARFFGTFFTFAVIIGLSAELVVRGLL